MHPTEWSESICIPSFDRSSYRRGTSVCRQISAPGGSTCRPAVDVRRHSGVKYESVRAAKRPSAFSETLTCFVGRSSKHHRSSVAYSTDSKPTCQLRPSSFFETCYVMPPDVTMASKTTYSAAVQSETVPRWYSSTMKFVTAPGSTGSTAPVQQQQQRHPSSSLSSDMNNNDGVSRQSVRSDSRHDQRAGDRPVSFRTRVVVNSVSGAA